MKAVQDKGEKSTKSNNDRCKGCRRCYNSGLCLMPWPGLGRKAPTKSRKDEKRQTQG